MNSNNTLPVIFNYEGKQIRSVNIDGKPWLVAKDVCDILELSDVSMATQILDEDEKGTSKICTPGGMQNMTVINEFGLYKLTFKSRKPKAKEFTRWVTHEVLPEIMRTGSYTRPDIAKIDTVPAVVHEQKTYLSRANFTAQEKIIDRAMDAKNDRDFQKVLALDLAFRKRTGFSALQAAGISIEKEHTFHEEIITDPEGYGAGHGWFTWSFKRHLHPALVLPDGEE